MPAPNSTQSLPNSSKMAGELENIDVPIDSVE